MIVYYVYFHYRKNFNNQSIYGVKENILNKTSYISICFLYTNDDSHQVTFICKKNVHLLYKYNYSYIFLI